MNPERLERPRIWWSCLGGGLRAGSTSCTLGHFSSVGMPSRSHTAIMFLATRAPQVAEFRKRNASSRLNVAFDDARALAASMMHVLDRRAQERAFVSRGSQGTLT